jgi:3-oxoacyl-[acyl-carrier protein] reductase
MDPAGKSIIVAGGAGQLGRVIVATLRGRGARVAVLDSEPREVEPGVPTFAADAADERQVAKALEAVIGALGRVDVLVNCLGLIHSEPLVNLLNPERRRHQVDSWDKVIRANLTAPFVLTTQVAEYMATTRTKGIIVNLSSIAAAGNPGQSAYSAAKAGVDALTVAWGKELGLLGIRVVGIAPGFMDVPSTHAALSNAALRDWVRKTPLRRLGAADEVVQAVMFAIQNDYLNARTIQIDGGLFL